MEEIRINNPNRIKELIKSLYWDYFVDADEIISILNGEKEGVFQFSKERILVRFIERLSWYDILDIFGKEYLKQNLTKSVIEKLRFQDLREKYELVRQILLGEPVSFTGWNPEYREKIKSTLLSNRWYSFK